ncbi:MAG: hypothetical protein JWQ35_1063 [Bacteriovoracaceae bacterium]|nr:hypothetical protein [Bacteriovoracaceae bacterium]
MLNRDVLIRALKRETEKTPFVLIGETQLKSYDFLFLYTSSENSSDQTEATELVKKMGEALKLSADRWLMKSLMTLDLAALSAATFDLSARFVVVLGATKDLDLKFPSELVKASSVEELLKKPEKKRELWEKLKDCLTKLDQTK